MRVTLLTPDGYRRMPWKNGLGVTTEIARSPADGEPFDWRVSVATVARDGPFSRFDGYDRIIAALDGAGMILTHPDTAVTATLGPLEPYEFNGDVATTCALRGGAIRDFNVMTRRDRFRAALSVIRLESNARLAGAAKPTLVYCLTGAAQLEARDETIMVNAEQTMMIECESGGEESLVFSPGCESTILIRVDLFRAG